MIHFVHVSISPLRENMSLEPIKIYVVSKEKFENCQPSHCVKSVRICSFYGPYFLALGLNTDRKIPNMGTFYAVLILLFPTPQEVKSTRLIE